MTTDTVRRIGRGGAGNLYTKKDVDGVSKPIAKDIESQLPLDPTRIHTPSSAANYARTGRGGAGNFTPSSDGAVGKGADEAVAVAASLAAKAKAKAKSGSGLSGRGGAGNWVGGGDGGGGAGEVDDQKKGEELERQALVDAEAKLAVPGRVYHGFK